MTEAMLQAYAPQ